MKFPVRAYNEQNPDDENAPLQPDKFIVSLYDGIGKGSAKAKEPNERRDDDNVISFSVLKWNKSLAFVDSTACSIGQSDHFIHKNFIFFNAKIFYLF